MAPALELCPRQHPVCGQAPGSHAADAVAPSGSCLLARLVCLSGVRVRPPKIVKQPLGFLCSLALPCSHQQVKSGFRICC